MKVIFIAGTGHCGSTLLDLLLGSHSKMFSLGEVYRIIQSPPSPICDICDDCDFWKPDLIRRLTKTYEPSIFSRIARKVGLTSPLEYQFYKEVSRAAGVDILVDSSKNNGWICRNEKALLRAGVTPYLIYLSRDARAVVNSYYRKYPEKGVEKLAQEWNQRVEKINKTFDDWNENTRLHIKYEDLAKNPEITIKNILSFLDISFEPGMMSFWKHQHHPVNGNAGTKSMLIRFQNQDKYEEWVEENNKGYYKEKKLGITFDERWKRELSEKEVEKIEKITHSLNKELKENGK